MRFLKPLRRAWEWLTGRWRKQLRVIDVAGDELPKSLCRDQVIRLIDDGEEWSAGMLCPCGCGDTIELMLLRGVKPRWNLTVDREMRPTLHPSVWRSVGCKSHFWVREGRVVWVTPMTQAGSSVDA